MEEEVDGAENGPRRSLRLALSEVNESRTEETTPNKTVNVDELLVIQRGPRKKPITWSPVDYDRIKFVGRLPKESTTPVVVPKGNHIQLRLRKRLIMSPEKSQSEELGHFIAKKLRTLKNLEKAVSIS